MTIDEVLAAEGYTAEESKALTDNPKNKALLSKILQQSEEGTTALLKAQELETNIRKFNDETVIPYGAKKDQEAAAARAEAAKYQTYLKSLKDADTTFPTLTSMRLPPKMLRRPRRNRSMCRLRTSTVRARRTCRSCLFRSVRATCWAMGSTSRTSTKTLARTSVPTKTSARMWTASTI